MTTTVFISGSRKINRLNDLIRFRIKNMIDQGFRIIVGDANGADKAVQSYLADMHYTNVFVYCAGEVCRNNVGGWDVKHVEVNAHMKGRDFYGQKDKAMTAEANYGLVLWDGKSAGSISNVLDLMKAGKIVVLYFGPEKHFHTLRSASDVKALLRQCSENDYRSLDRKIHFVSRLEALHHSIQTSFDL